VAPSSHPFPPISSFLFSLPFLLPLRRFYPPLRKSYLPLRRFYLCPKAPLAHSLSSSPISASHRCPLPWICQLFEVFRFDFFKIRFVNFRKPHQKTRHYIGILGHHSAFSCLQPHHHQTTTCCQEVFHASALCATSFWT
jgi:hypothetical protein